MKLAHVSDCELVRLTWAGDESAFTELVARNDGHAFQVALTKMNGNRFYAEEAVQNAQISCWRAAQSGAEAPRVFPDWYLDIVRKRCFDLYKQRQRSADWMSFEELPESVASPMGQIIQAEDCINSRSYLRGAIDLLPAQQSQAVRMRYLEDCDYAVIAEAMGLEERTARNHVTGGLAALRKRLKPETLKEFGLEVGGRGRRAQAT